MIGPNPKNKFQCKNFLFTGVQPTTEPNKGHVTDVIGRIPA